MKVTAVQKIIKVGSSGAVTVPSKVMKQLDLTYGEDVEVTFQPVPKPESQSEEIMKDYTKFVAQYGQTLKNLAQR